MCLVLRATRTEDGRCFLSRRQRTDGAGTEERNGRHRSQGRQNDSLLSASAPVSAAKSLPPVRSNSAAYIFRNNQRRRAPLLAEVFISRQKGQNVPDLGAFQSRAVASQGKVLTREGSPGKISYARQIFVREAATSSILSSLLPQFCWYAAPFFSSMSFDKRHVHVGPRPARAMPPPAKNS